MTREEHIENLKAIASDMPSDKCADWIDSLMAGVKALEQEPCEDAVSRQAVLDLPRIKTHNVWGNVIYESVDVENVRQLPSVTPQPCGDAISRQAALEILNDAYFLKLDDGAALQESVNQLPSVTPQPKMGSSSENPNKWIPITSRPMTEEEKEHYKTHPEYQDDYRIFNCKLPDDGQEVLISVYGGVEVDTFVQDANDGCYFEGRDIYDVDAWMPIPQPYKAEGSEE